MFSSGLLLGIWVTSCGFLATPCIKSRLRIYLFFCLAGGTVQRVLLAKLQGWLSDEMVNLGTSFKWHFSYLCWKNCCMKTFWELVWLVIPVCVFSGHESEVMVFPTTGTTDCKIILIPNRIYPSYISCCTAICKIVHMYIVFIQMMYCFCNVVFCTYWF